MKVIKTSEPNWLEQALEEYKEKNEFNFVDDAEIGITREDLKSAVHLIRAARKKANFSANKIVTVLFGIGLTAVGVYIVVAAIADPEPTSKLTLLIAGGLLLSLTGGYSTLRALGVKFAVKAAHNNTSFEIRPE